MPPKGNNQSFAPPWGVLHTPGIERICNVAAMVCRAVHAVAYRAYAIRSYKWRKTSIDYFPQNTPKTIWDVGKTMSYAGKIISDIIQTTSDIIFAVAIHREATTYVVLANQGQFTVSQRFAQILCFRADVIPFGRRKSQLGCSKKFAEVFAMLGF